MMSCMLKMDCIGTCFGRRANGIVKRSVKGYRDEKQKNIDKGISFLLEIQAHGFHYSAALLYTGKLYAGRFHPDFSRFLSGGVFGAWRRAPWLFRIGFLRLCICLFSHCEAIPAVDRQYIDKRRNLRENLIYLKWNAFQKSFGITINRIWEYRSNEQKASGRRMCP